MSAPGRSFKRTHRRPPHAHGQPRGRAAAALDRAADLRLGPALVRRLRDRGGARRAGCDVGRLARADHPDLGGHRGAADGRGAVVPADDLRLPERRRLLRRGQGEPRPAGRARGGRVAAGRLRAHGRRLDRLGRAGGHLGRARALHARRRAQSRRARRARARQPARRARVGLRLRAADLRLHHRDRRHDRRRPRARHALRLAHCPRPRSGARRARDRGGHRRAAARVRLGLQRADGRRGDLERRHGVPAPAGAQRRQHAASRWA